MKKVLFSIVTLVACMLLASCGAKKNVAQQQPQYPPLYQPYYQQPPTSQSVEDYQMQKVMEEQRNMNTCRYMALHWSDNDIRGYGQGSGFDEEEARSVARLNAESELNKILNEWASDFEETTNTAMQLNGVNRNERVHTQDRIRFAEGDMIGAHVLHETYEKGAHNSVICHICMSIDANAATNAMLSQAVAKDLIKTAEQGREYAAKAREDIRLLRTGENIETKKAQVNNQMRQDNLDKQHQRNMEETALAKNTTPGNSNMYSLSINGQTYGPYNYAQLQQMVPAQQITPDTYVWRQGLTDWVKIKDLPELSGLFGVPGMPVPPPAPKY